MSSGNIELDKSVRPFPADCNTMEFDRNIQNKMFTQKKLGRWAIIHSKF